MKSGRVLLGGAVLTGCLGFLGGCSSTPQKPEVSAQVGDAGKSKVTVPVAEALVEQEVEQVERPRGRTQQGGSTGRQQQASRSRGSAQASAAQQKLAQLRLRRQQEWERQQAEQEKRAEYQREWQQNQSRQQAQVRQQPVQGQQSAEPGVITYGGKGVGHYAAASLTGDFAGDPRLLYFIDQMSRQHGFDKAYLNGVFSQVRNRDEVARLWAGNAGGSATPGGWYNYRSKFVTPANIQKGTQFWQKYGVHLQRASRQFGVDPEYIVGIMGVETRWGRILGKHRVIDALTTSALVNQRRSDFFFQELENYMLMTRSERMDPLAPKGSYAGAMGYGQFMPSSFRSYAVDFDGDGVRDLWNPVDAIGSIANYFAQHGWKGGQEVAVPADVSGDTYANVPDGYKVTYSPNKLADMGVAPRSGRWSSTGRTHLLALTTVPGGHKEPWIGYHNFYVITRYNHSNYYAMAVHQLAKAVESKVGGGNYASQ